MDLWNIVVNVVLLALFIAVLDRSSYAVITGAYDISKLTKLGYSSIGFIYVAFLTSLPEATVSLFAIPKGEVGIAIGNVFGSNIANICLILGVPIVYSCALKSTSPKCSFDLGKQEFASLFFGLFISSVLSLFLLRSTRYVPFIGVVLIGIFIVYNYSLSKSSTNVGMSNITQRGTFKRAFGKGMVYLLIGIVGVLISGYVIVHSALNLATAFSLSGTFIGATVIAVGTSLPELSISFKSIQTNRMDFALATAVGSSFANLTIIMGSVFVFSTIAVRVEAYFDLVFFSLISNFFLWYFLTRGKLALKEGLILIFIYIIFLIEFIGIYTFF
ncbi:MAG: hypothetical protein NWF08_07735 [Candidatus Bathyarchaeota archaeon]|nr:hypothetical protein [Candidatus Bathyarchaeota archaeon]